MLSYFSPNLGHCSGHPERFSNPSVKNSLFRVECSEIAEQDLLSKPDSIEWDIWDRMRTNKATN